MTSRKSASPVNLTTDTRNEMKSFWLKYSTSTNNQSMMLDSNADKLGLEEMPEVLSFLPNWTDKRLLELASGIGRFTGSLAECAKHVTTVDFVEEFVQKNKENNRGHDNVTFIADDVMNLKFEKDSYDMIFSSWLLMYFTDDEIKVLLQRLLNWLKFDGYLFFRESCHELSGDLQVEDNPAFYRTQNEFNRHLRDFVPDSSEDGIDWHLEMVFARPLLSYVKMKKSGNQICWLLRKRRGIRSSDTSAGLTPILKNSFSPVEGRSKRTPLQNGDHQEEGLIEQKHLKSLELKPGQKVLDIGCGDGSLAVYLAKKYGVDVIGIDSSLDAIAAAWEKQGKLCTDATVCFEYGDIMERKLPSEFIDVIYIRNGSDDVTDKLAMFIKLKLWLKYGGKLMVHEVCKNSSSPVNGTPTSKETLMDDFVKVFGDTVKILSSNEEDRWFLGEKTN